jgi:hypothetical protein
VKPVVAVVGAFDRFNFGDLLFPHMVRHAFERLGVEATYRCFSLRAADLRKRGGVLTEPLASLKNLDLPEGSIVVVAGGEVLTARWLDAFAGLGTPHQVLAAKILARTFGPSAVDWSCRRLLGGDRPLPWVLTAGDVGSDCPVAYNAVGGIGLARLPKRLREAARDRLRDAAYLAVRDPETKGALDRLGLAFEVDLTPDSAVLAPEVCPKEGLFSSASETTRAVLRRLNGRYIAFQAGRYPAWGKVAILAEQLRKIHLETGFGVLLLPLGQAAGHEDNEPLQKIAGLLEDVPAEHIPSPDVADTLACIAGARLFVGSSLHGNLMALVYGVPHVGFGERVRKLDLMLRTWDPTRPNGATLPSAIAADALKVLEGDQQVLTRAASSLREAALTALETQSRLLR